MLQRVFRGIVGGLVLMGAALMRYHSPNWIYFLVLVGFMLAQSAFTDRCPLLMLLEKMGMRQCEEKSRPDSPAAVLR